MIFRVFFCFCFFLFLFLHILKMYAPGYSISYKKAQVSQGTEKKKTWGTKKNKLNALHV